MQLDFDTIEEAETCALLYGIAKAWSHGTEQLIIETDSL